MELKNNTQTGMAAEIKLFPLWAWSLAGIGFIGAQIFFNVVLADQADAPAVWVRAALGLMAGLVLGCYVLFIGYVNRDARRRGMSSTLWTLVAILIPNGLGILLYFILRQPIPRAAPEVAAASGQEHGSCPNCGYKLSPSCPQCQRAVSVGDRYCRSCGTALASVTDADHALSSK